MKEDIVAELLQQWAIEHPNLDTSALGIVVRIQMLAKLLQGRTTRALAIHELKHWEYDVLSVLRRQGAPYEMPASEIARAALLTTGAMTTRIDGLEERKLVRRRQTSEDGRSVLIRLTGNGLRLVDSAIGTRISDANEALALIPADRMEKLTAALQQLILHVEK